MEDASPPQTPVSEQHVARSRSRSIASATAASLPPPPVHYSPETHPTTDPSLLAISQQQVADTSMQVESQLLDPGQLPDAPAAFPIDPALGGGAPSEPNLPHIDMSHPTSTTLDVPSFPDGNTVQEESSQRASLPAVEDAGAGSSGRNSKRASVTEDSDAELRRLAEENKDVPLDELARRVRNDENSPSAERTRQVYGLGWLLKNCERVPDTSIAVPRNRVYARYVGICANERIKPLNPASFGKLVRLLYPEIKTRRLGVRGQSKYHYCGIRLFGEHSSPKVSHGPGSASGSEPPALAAGDDHLPNNASGTAPFGTFGPTQKSSYSSADSFQSPLSSFMLNELCFSRSIDPDNVRSPHDAFRIPDIDPYVPPRTDPDIAATLTAIYRSHCTSLVECVRYMRLKQFHQLFLSFHGTLTVPVQKLLAEPSVAPWIRESDWVMYKEMIRLLSPLALQAAPPVVLTALRGMSNNLKSHITTTFSVQPAHVVEAKVATATIFASLLDRLLRVNDAAHAAARFLGHPPDREQMIKDWEAYVDAQAIVDREIPCVAPLAKHIIQNEIPSLLKPINHLQNGSSIDQSSSTESVLDRWTNFLTTLHERFNVPSPRQFNIILGAAASAALRDLTTNGAISFGSWWVVRCWVDEWMSWQAERGGFLRHPTDHRRSSRNRRSTGSDALENGDELGHDDSGISVRGDHMSLLEDVGEDRVNRMININFVKEDLQ